MDAKTFEELVFKDGIRLGESPYDPTKLTIDQGTDAVFDELFSAATYNKIKNHWHGGSLTEANPANGMIESLAAGSKLRHRSGGGWDEVLQLTRSFDVSPLFDHLGLGGAAVDADIGINFDEVMTDTDNSEKAGFYSVLQVSKIAADMTGSGAAFYGYCILDATNTQNWTNGLAGMRGVVGRIGTEPLSAGTVTGAANFLTYTDIADAATVTNLYGILISTPVVANNKVTNEYGIYIQTQDTGLTLNYAIYTNAGVVRFGDIVFINETVNTFMTGAGLTINQGAATDEIIALKSTSVTHGMTTPTEADTFATFERTGAIGGVEVRGWSSGQLSLYLVGSYTTDDATKANNAVAPVIVRADKRSGTTIGAPGADANIFCVYSHNVCVALVDEDGDIYYDGAAPQHYPDKYDDVVLIDDLKRYLSAPKDLKVAFKNFVKYNRQKLIETGVISEGDFISTKGMNALLLGAISQLGQKTRMLEKKLNLLKDN